MKRPGLLLDIDALLDTRLATLCQLRPVETLDLRGYYARDRDVFPGISFEEFSQAYANRDEKTLSQSLRTRMVAWVQHLCRGMLEISHRVPAGQPPKVYVNFYPYVLPSSTQNAILAAVQCFTSKAIAVTGVNWSPSDLTPTLIKERVQTVVCYDPFEWMDAQADRLTKTPIPSIALVSPLRVKTPDRSICAADIPNQLGVLTAGIVDCRWLSIDYFCSDITAYFPPPKA